MIVSTESYASTICRINEHPTVTWDTETTGLDWRRDHIVGVAIRAGGHAYYFPFRHQGEGTNLEIEYLPQLFKSCMQPDRPQICHNFSYDAKISIKDGYELPTPQNLYDSFIAAHTMNENEGAHKLEYLGERYITKGAAQHEDALMDWLVAWCKVSKIPPPPKARKGWQKQFIAYAPIELVAPYACNDVELTARLHAHYEPHLKRWKLYDHYRRRCEFQRYVLDAELRGVALDLEALNDAQLKAEIEARKRYQSIRTRMVNDLEKRTAKPSSYADVRRWLKVKSSSKDALRKSTDPRAAEILSWRAWEAAGARYYRPFREFSEGSTLRYNVNVCGTISGRPSGGDPSLFQIPRTGDEHYHVKDCFVARPGYTMFEIDYARAELVIAAHFSKDPKLVDAIKRNEDLHTKVAEELKIPRPIAKNVNFSVWYRIGTQTFSERYHVPINEAEDYLRRYHAAYPGARRLAKATELHASTYGYIRFFNGRIRRFNTDGNDFIGRLPNGERPAPYWKAANNLIQGTVAAMLEESYIKIAKTLPEIRIFVPIYDSLWGEVPTPALSALREAAKIMESQPWCSMPVRTETKVGDRWSQMTTMS